MSEPGGPEAALAEARREASFYRQQAEEAGRRRLREAEDLSRLLERAEAAEQALQCARDELERRVEERTAALSEANARLEREAAERERAEVERLRLEHQMEQAQRLESLGVLAGGIAHDFNNLLTAILANVAMLRGEVAGDGAQCLADAEAAARAAAGLCQQMLAYAGRAQFVPGPVRLGELVGDMVQLLRASVAREHGLELRLAEGLPPVTGAPSQLRQVVMNLVINAAEAMEGRAGTVTVSTALVAAGPERLGRALLGEALPGGRYVCLEVADTGRGMDPATQRRIFEPFFSTKFSGRGLGLSAVLGIVRQAGGAIELETAAGQGARFRVLGPVAAAAAPARAAEAPAAAPWRGQGPVLVVDDDAPVRRAAGRLLRRLGFEPIEADGGAAALAVARAAPARFRAVLLDLTMPGLDGVATLRGLREAMPGLAVVVASGHDEGAALARFGADRPDAFLQKPFELEALRQALRRVLEPGP